MSGIREKSGLLRRLGVACAGILLAGSLAVAPALASSPSAGAASSRADVSQKADKGETRTFVDSAGREVVVPTEITRIIPSGNMAQLFLWPLASDKLVSVSTSLTDAQMAVMGDSTKGMPETGNLYMTGSELNIEEVASLNPQIIIDFGEPKDSIIEDLDNLEDLLGIPCVFIEGGLESTGDAYRMLGDLLDMPDEAEELATYVDGIVDTVNETFETVDKKDAVVLTGSDGLGCVASGTYFDEVWAYMLNNVAKVDEGQMYASTGIDFEQLANWDPSFIFFYNCNDPASLVGSDLWSQLKAVQDKTTFEVPTGAHNLVSPPSVNRYLGIVWIAETVYPESFDWDLRDMTEQYYKLFYHHDLTDAEYDALMGASVEG